MTVFNFGIMKVKQVNSFQLVITMARVGWSIMRSAGAFTDEPSPWWFV